MRDFKFKHSGTTRRVDWYIPPFRTSPRRLTPNMKALRSSQAYLPEETTYSVSAEPITAQTRIVTIAKSKCRQHCFMFVFYLPLRPAVVPNFMRLDSEVHYLMPLPQETNRDFALYPSCFTAQKNMG